MRVFVHGLAGLLLAGVPWCALAQQPAAPVALAPPVQVDAARQPVSTDVMANQAPRDPVDVKRAAGQQLPLNSLAGLRPDYKIAPNDLIEIEVYGVPDLKRTVRVNSSGSVNLALVGVVPLLGLTAQQAEAEIARRYGDKYLQNPQVSLFIKEFTTQRITIEGAVGRPGIYPITGNLTMLLALALAGGGAQYANLDEIMLYRTNPDGVREKSMHNLDKIRSGEAPDVALLSEDIIVVPRSGVRTFLRDSLIRDIIDSINPFSSLGGTAR
jgi:polysaccharide biosynthesis/export protein